MGLDSVELIMAFEEEFEVDIPDAVAEQLLSVGDVVDYMAEALKARGERPDAHDIYFRVRGITVRQLNADPDRIMRSTRFVDDLGVD